MQPKIPTAEKMASTLSQHRLAVAIKFSVIAVAVMAFYVQDLSIVFKGALTDESTCHIFAIDNPALAWKSQIPKKTSLFHWLKI
jgi:hypothetical protein